MKKGFNEARAEVKEALGKQRAELVTRREILASFEKALDSAKKACNDNPDSVDEVILDILHNQVVRETQRMNLIEMNIRDLERTLKEKYSVTPKYLAV